MKDESSALESYVRLERKQSSTDRILFLWRSVVVSTAVQMPDMCTWLVSTYHLDVVVSESSVNERGRVCQR